MGTISDYRGVAVAAPVSTGYCKHSDHDAAWFIGGTLAALLSESGIAKDDIDGLALASYTNHPDTAVVTAAHLGLELRWLADLPMGGAAGVIALRRAARAVQSGDANVVVCIGADAMAGAAFDRIIADFSSFSRDYVYPYGASGPNGVFALITSHYMERTGATREDFGRICLAQRAAAAANPVALLRDPMTLDEYLAAPPVADPLGLYDCVMPACGGDGFLVMAEDRARGLGLPFATIAGALERHNAFAGDPVQTRGGWEIDRDAMYDAAGKGPDDMDFLQAYDDYPVIVMLQLEGLGFCPPGEAPGFVRQTSLAPGGGGLPVNTGGGQLSIGQAGAAGGFLGVAEGLRQVTGRSPGLLVPDAATGVVSGYGYVDYDRGLCCAAVILARAEKP